MPESTSSPHVTVEDMHPRVDFASYWRVEAEQWYTYGVPSHHVLLVESGRLRARTPRGDVSAGPGDLLCLRRELPNHYGYSGAVCYWETHLSFAPAPRTAWPLWLDGQPIPDVVALGSHASAARSAFESLCLHLDRGGDLAQLRVGMAVNALLGAIASALGRSAAPVRRSDPWQRARARLEADLGRVMTVADVARHMQVGEDHFIRGFRRRFGISPMAYRAQAKLRWASVALASETPVKEVAKRLGFADASAFARAFRRQFGVSPSEMRVAGSGAGAPAPAPEQQSDLPFPVNRHIQPEGSTTEWFAWG